MKKIMLAGFLLAGIMGANAQTIRVVAAGSVTTTTLGGSSSVNIGRDSGNTNTSNTGNENVFVGTWTGIRNTNGMQNVFVGSYAGASNTTGLNNTYLGFNCGQMANGNNNTFVGSLAGQNNLTGLGNVFLGYNAGYNETGSNKLYVANTNTTNPLIWGDFNNSQLKLNGKVGIGGNAATGFGTIPTTVGGVSVVNYKLFVKGGILTEEIRVGIASTWADYVFAKDYTLKPLAEVEEFIAKNKHLPNVPSAAQVKEEGINVGEMARIQQEKIEELTLYIIAQNKRIEALEAKMSNK